MTEAETRQHQRIAELEAKLEVDPRHGYDGIDCRDETIKMQDESIGKLKAELEALGTAAVPMVWVACKDQLPTLLPETDLGGEQSKAVLVFDGSSQMVAYYERTDPDCTAFWRSACSEGWKLTSIKFWAHLPSNPAIAQAVQS